MPTGWQCSAGARPGAQHSQSGTRERPQASAEPWRQIKVAVRLDVMLGTGSYLGRAMSKQKKWKKEK